MFPSSVRLAGSREFGLLVAKNARHAKKTYLQADILQVEHRRVNVGNILHPDQVFCARCADVWESGASFAKADSANQGILKHLQVYVRLTR